MNDNLEMIWMEAVVAYKGRGKPWKTWVRINDVPAYIRTERLPNASIKLSAWANFARWFGELLCGRRDRRTSTASLLRFHFTYFVQITDKRTLKFVCPELDLNPWPQSSRAWNRSSVHSAVTQHKLCSWCSVCEVTASSSSTQRNSVFVATACVIARERGVDSRQVIYWCSAPGQLLSGASEIEVEVAIVTWSKADLFPQQIHHNGNFNQTKLTASRRQRKKRNT
jgi:hypothetical protein